MNTTPSEEGGGADKGLLVEDEEDSGEGMRTRTGE
jgi:hypothetical protein